LRVQQKGFDLLTQQQSIIWHEGQRLTQRLTKSSAFCDPILPIEKNMFFDGFAKLQTERIQIILGNSLSTLSNDLHLAKAEQERTGTRGNENARWQQRQGEHCGRGRGSQQTAARKSRKTCGRDEVGGEADADKESETRWGQAAEE
jgi:hypothetical protein